MDLKFRQAVVDAINKDQNSSLVISSLDFKTNGTGTITYCDKVWVDPKAPGFQNSTTSITDEELVRAYLLLRLVSMYRYPASQSTFEVERVYKPVGRPIGKGGRVDVLIRTPPKNGNNQPFLFIECKAPSKFDSDLKFIDGQLFRLSKQEATRPRLHLTLGILRTSQAFFYA